MKVFIITKRSIVGLIGILLSAVLLIFLAVQGVAAIQASVSKRLIPIYNVKTEEKKVALSFDAAWGNEQTQTLIDILNQCNVKTTFFVVGAWVDRYPDSVKALVAAGHEVCNHSNTHPHMPKLNRNDMLTQLNSCNQKIKSITGITPVLFRPPYGDYDNALMETVKSVNMYPIQWDVDSLDWKNPTPSQIVNRVMSQVKPGSIILFHNGALNTPTALPSVIKSLQDKGYQIVPVSQLIYKDNYTIDSAGMQIKNE